MHLILTGWCETRGADLTQTVPHFYSSTLYLCTDRAGEIFILLSESAEMIFISLFWHQISCEQTPGGGGERQMSPAVIKHQ